MICINIPVRHEDISERRKTVVRKTVERISADEVHQEKRESWKYFMFLDLKVKQFALSIQ
jgi:hypothetical protein